MSNKTYIMWYWRYHSLDFSIHDNLDDAINDARWGSDHGELSFDSIEVFEDGVGTVLDGDEVMTRWREIERADEEEHEAKQAAAPVATAVICLLTPEGKHGGVLDYIYGNTAEDMYKLGQYEQTFGDRIKVEDWPWLIYHPHYLVTLLTRTWQEQRPPPTTAIATKRSAWIA